MLKSFAIIIFEIILRGKKIGFSAAIQLAIIGRSKKQRIKKLKIKLFEQEFDVFLRTATSDISVFNQIFIKRDYNINFPFKPINILDAGANIGLSSKFFSVKYPNSKIFALEPDKDNFEMLKLNTTQEKNVFNFNNALWNEKCILKISNNVFNKDAIVVSKDENNGCCEVSALNVDDLLEINNILGFDIVKLDIEGSEASVFSNNINWLKSVRVIIIELHDWIDPNCSKIVFKALLDWGFCLLVRGENLICFRDYNDYIGSIRK